MTITEPHGLSPSDKVHCSDANWVVDEISWPDVKGAHWLGSDHAANINESDQYLEFQVLQDTEALYIAYDSRATQKPAWLEGPNSEFVKLPLNQNESHYIKITKSDADSSGKKEMVKLALYQRKTAPQKNDLIKLPGNLNGDDGWPPGISDPAMYMVIVKPQVEDDCTQTEISYHLRYEEHHSNIELVRYAAKLSCEENPLETVLYAYICGEAICTKTAGSDHDAVKTETGLTLAPVSFLVSSEIEFNPSLYTSKANVSIAGHNYTRDVTGTLHFEYVLNDSQHLKTMQINSMLLRLDPIDTSIGNFTDITVALLAPLPAQCMDSNPLFAKPCDTYRIQNKNSVANVNEKFITSVTAKKGDDLLVYVAQNANVLDIAIDHARREFKIIGGPLTTMVNIDGEDKELAIDIDLTGHFLNFAPQALGTESTRFAECGYQRSTPNQPGSTGRSTNKEQIVLDGSASFEVYGDPIPNSAYRWFEDYGLVTEHEFLPPERKKLIDKWQMSFGVHDITLVIQDDRGITDMDTFKVEVGDTQPPVLQVPTDVFVLPQQPGPVEVNLGPAWSYDICSPDVLITNDAPKESMFAPGVSTVLWTADDGRGHTVSTAQQIYVFKVMSGLGVADRIRELESLVGSISTSVLKSAPTAQACRAADRCVVSFAGLSQTIDQASAVLAKTIVPEESRELQEATIHRLQRASGILAEADVLIRRSGTSPDQRAQLRNRAAETAKSTKPILEETAEMIRRLII